MGISNRTSVHRPSGDEDSRAPKPRTCQSTLENMNVFLFSCGFIPSHSANDTWMQSSETAGKPHCFCFKPPVFARIIYRKCLLLWYSMCSVPVLSSPPPGWPLRSRESQSFSSRRLRRICAAQLLSFPVGKIIMHVADSTCPIHQPIFHIFFLIFHRCFEKRKK